MPNAASAPASWNTKYLPLTELSSAAAVNNQGLRHGCVRCLLSDSVLFRVAVVVACYGWFGADSVRQMGSTHVGRAVGRDPCLARRQRGAPVCPPGNLAVARMVLGHRSGPLPSPLTDVRAFSGEALHKLLPCAYVPAGSSSRGGWCEPSPGLAPPWPPLRLKLPGYSAGFSKTTPFIPPGRTAVPGIGKRGPLLICAGRKVTAGDACVLEAVSGASEAVALGSEILLGPPGPEGSPIRHQLLLADPLRLCTLQASLTTTPIPNVVSGHTPFPCLLPSSLTSCFSVHCPAGSGPLGTPLFPHCPILR